MTGERGAVLRECIETPAVLAAIEAALNSVAHERHAGLVVSDQAEAVKVMRAVLRAVLGEQEATPPEPTCACGRPPYVPHSPVVIDGKRCRDCEYAVWQHNGRWWHDGGDTAHTRCAAAPQGEAEPTQDDDDDPLAFFAALRDNVLPWTARRVCEMTPEQVKAHRRHMTDGRWHDDCRACEHRRVYGGTGLEPLDVAPQGEGNTDEPIDGEPDDWRPPWVHLQ